MDNIRQPVPADNVVAQPETPIIPSDGIISQPTKVASPPKTPILVPILFIPFAIVISYIAALFTALDGPNFIIYLLIYLAIFAVLIAGLFKRSRLAWFIALILGIIIPSLAIYMVVFNPSIDPEGALIIIPPFIFGIVALIPTCVGFLRLNRDKAFA